MEIKTKKLFKELVKKLTMELLDEESIEEITTTAAVPGYSTPFAFGKMKKKRKKNIEKQTGYKFVDEALSNDDIKKIKKEIRKEVSDILFDIWVKRSSWGGK